MAVLLRVLKKTGVFCAVMGVGWCLMTVTTPSREDVMKVWTKIRVDSCICIMLYIIIHIYIGFIYIFMYIRIEASFNY